MATYRHDELIINRQQRSADKGYGRTPAIGVTLCAIGCRAPQPVYDSRELSLKVDQIDKYSCIYRTFAINRNDGNP